MSEIKLSDYLCVQKTFDSQLEEYLLSDWRKCERSEQADILGTMWSLGRPVDGNLSQILRKRVVIFLTSQFDLFSDSEEVTIREYQQTNGCITGTTLV